MNSLFCLGKCLIQNPQFPWEVFCWNQGYMHGYNLVSLLKTIPKTVRSNTCVSHIFCESSHCVEKCCFIFLPIFLARNFLPGWLQRLWVHKYWYHYNFPFTTTFTHLPFHLWMVLSIVVQFGSLGLLYVEPGCLTSCTCLVG